MATTSQGSTQEFTVHVTRECRKKFQLLRFASGCDVDFTKLKGTTVKLDRENNLREYKSAHDIDVAPKYGGGSVFGREQKEEARRRKYGIMMKKYDVEKQPWMLRVGSGKQAKKYKGVREGTVSENTSYYIFTQKPDGSFEAFPVDEWYTFSQVIKYKYLNTEEAEDEFNRRDKTLNYFNIMLKKRMRNEDEKGNVDKEETEKAGNSRGKKDKDFMLTEMEDWAIMSDEDNDDEMDGKDKDDDSDEGRKSKKKKGKKEMKDEKKKRPKNAKKNSDDEAIEESDEGDFDDREVDYMTGSESSLSDSEIKGDDKEEEKGVDEERGLRKLIDSEAESEEENKEEENEEDKEENVEKSKKGSGSDSSSSESSDSDLEKDVTSPLFIQKNVKKAEGQRSRPSTPLNAAADVDRKGQKRKQDPDSAISSKKARTNSPLLAAGPAGDGITEESVRRYLMRKPMTTKDLLQKFKSKKINMTSEQVATVIAQILKKINPDQNYVNKTLYLSLKAPDK